MFTPAVWDNPLLDGAIVPSDRELGNTTDGMKQFLRRRPALLYAVRADVAFEPLLV